jgi:ABC-2 type transport system permease protein
MSELAGNGISRYRHFQDQVETFHATWRQFFEPRIMEGIAITEADFAKMPRWTWQEQDASIVRSDVLYRTIQMLLWAALLTALCLVKLRRYPAT